MSIARRSLLEPALALILAIASPSIAADPAIDFVRDVQPILAGTCYRCHGVEKQKGGLRLDVRASAFKGGDSKEPAITPGKVDSSAILARVSSKDESTRMPPKGDRLTAGQVETLRRWVASGANWPESAGTTSATKPAEMKVGEADRQHWAFRPLRVAELPGVRSGWERTSVDRFIKKALDARKLTPAAEADREALLRRVYFDLIGLPPSLEEREEFLGDKSPDAYEQLVNRLLADSRYGERWGRHWLDVARYADSYGYERDADRPNAYHYRDFVIKAFNKDVPFDTFVRWQLAGDEDVSRNELAKVATGFLAAGPLVTSDTKLEEEIRRYRYDELDDIVSTTGSAMLGLTIGCARCHDHKYDPIPTRDYYRLLAAFSSTKRSPENEPLIVTEKSSVPDESWLLERGDVMSRKEKVTLGFLSVLTRGKAPGDYLATARQGTQAKTTFQRSALALWMTDVDNGAGALVARVMVNRIWQHHFGEGLVRTPSDFGLRGEPPTHPELLEWLAGRFVSDGWSVKSMHRLIMSSAVYRQGVAFDPNKAAIDPENRLLWHRRPLRLEAEVLRDTMLAAAGVLNSKQFGPGVKPPVPAESLLTAYNTLNPYPKDARDDESTRRRSIYLFIKRSLRTPLIEVFDGADPSSSCARRIPTTVAPQALALLNDPLVRRRAVDFAARLIKVAANDDPRLVREAYLLTLSREPRASELTAATAFIAERTRARASRGKLASEARDLAVADFCHALFGLNEFMYVD